MCLSSDVLTNYVLVVVLKKHIDCFQEAVHLNSVYNRSFKQKIMYESLRGS